MVEKMNRKKRTFLNNKYAKHGRKIKYNSTKKNNGNLYYSYNITYNKPYIDIIKMKLFKKELYTLAGEDYFSNDYNK